MENRKKREELQSSFKVYSSPTDNPKAQSTMRICLVTRVLPSHMRGGVQDHVFLLARGISRFGHEVVVLTTARYDGIVHETIDGIRIEYLPKTNPGQNDQQWRKESIQRIITLHKEKSFDILHGQGSDTLYILRNELRARLSIPIVISFHGTTWDYFKTVLLYGFSRDPLRCAKSLIALFSLSAQYLVRELFFVRRAAALIATSNEQSMIFRQCYFLPKEKIVKVYNGIDSDIFTPGNPNSSIRSTLALPSDAPLILCAARLIYAKGVQYAIQALQEVLKNIPNAILVIVGDGNYRFMLEKLVRETGVQTHVRFVGSVPIEQLPEYFRLCDVFVNATHQQNGYDLTMAEAMACEKVVVASNIGSTPTLISHDIDGLLFKTADVQLLAAVLIEILNDKEKRARIGKAARLKINQYFNQDTMVRNTINVYDRLIAHKE
jgi:glycosyltransferase involved in cell wall biosynthesis